MRSKPAHLSLVFPVHVYLLLGHHLRYRSTPSSVLLLGCLCVLKFVQVHIPYRCVNPENSLRCYSNGVVQARWSPSTGNGKEIGIPTPKEESICNWCILASEKAYSSVHGSGYINHTLGQVHTLHRSSWLPYVLLFDCWVV